VGSFYKVSSPHCLRVFGTVEVANTILSFEDLTLSNFEITLGNLSCLHTMNPILENRPSEPPLHESESSATLDQPLQRPERSTLPPAKYEILAEIIEDDNTGEWRNIQPGQEKYESQYSCHACDQVI
jgi:hypothetical protein